MTTPRADAPADRSSRRVVLFAATLGSFLTPFMGSSINVALPTIGREFAMDAVLLSWVAASYLLAAAAFLVPFGRLADIRGRKRVFIWGILVYTVSSALAARAGSGHELIAVRVAQGIGGAMIFGTGIAILTSVFPAGERGHALGINVAAVYLGLSLGPFLGGFLTHNIGWRSVFAVNAAIGLVTALLVIFRLKGEWGEAKGERFDLWGSILYAATVASMMLGLTRIPSASGGWLVLGGAAGLAALLWWERRVEYAVLNTSLFRRNRVFAFSNLAALVNYSATSAVGFLMSLYLQYVKGFTPVAAGVVLIAQPAVMCLLSPFAGRLSDKVESRTVASIGMAITVVALILFATIDAASGLARVVIGLAVLGFGLALFSSPNTNAVMCSVERRFYGVSSATLGTARLVGQMLSMGIAMLMFSVFVGKVQIEPSSHPQFLSASRAIFGIFAALSFAGIFASLARGRVRG